jgi:hypothetical protein
VLLLRRGRLLEGLLDLSLHWRYTYSMRSKNPTSFRLTPEALRLLGLLGKELGLNQTSVLETAIRELAKRKGIERKK